MSNEETEKELSFDDINLVSDRKTVKHPVPEWKGFIFLTAWTGKQRSAFEEACAKLDSNKGKLLGVELFYARLLFWGCSNEDGTPKFTENQAKQIVATRNSSVLNDIIEAIKQLNGISKEDVDQFAGN